MTWGVRVPFDYTFIGFTAFPTYTDHPTPFILQVIK